jgi:O-antigen ligase
VTIQSQNRNVPALSPRAAGVRSKAVSQPQELEHAQVVRFLLLHAPLMLVFINLPFAATLHSLLTVLVGLHFLIQDKHPIRVSWVLAYIAGAEILWRGAESTLVWEYGKYTVLFLSVLALLKYRLLNKVTLWPILFLLALLPGVFVAPIFDREAISFQLAGPIALAVASLFFSAVEFRKSDLQRLFLAMVAPTLSMGVLILYYALTGNIEFSGAGANEVVTGGIGANQVTSAVSFGVMGAFFLAFLNYRDVFLRNLMIALAVGLTIASVLTFSRAGLWNTLGAVLIAALFLSRDRWRSGRFFNTVLVLAVLAAVVIFPFLMNLTGGALAQRFSDMDSTGRDVLVEIDYQVFLDNPIWGVGVGQSIYYHLPYFGYPKPTHTEYTRLLAEHGFFGVMAIVILLGVTLSRMFSGRSSFSKSVSTGFTIWALLYMLHSATRMVAPSLAFGLGAARFLTEEDTESQDTPAVETHEKPLAYPHRFRR